MNRALIAVAALVVILAAGAYLSSVTIPEESIGFIPGPGGGTLLEAGTHFVSPLGGRPHIYPIQLPSLSNTGAVDVRGGERLQFDYVIMGRLNPNQVGSFHEALEGESVEEFLQKSAGRALMQTIGGAGPFSLASGDLSDLVQRKAAAALEQVGVYDVKFEMSLPGSSLLVLARKLLPAGNVNAIRGQVEEAVAASGETDWAAHTAMGMVLEGEKNLRGAEDKYLDALTINPIALPPMARLFNLYMAVKEYEKLDRILLAAIEQDPESTDHLNWLSASYMRQGRLEEALRPATDATEVDPNNPILINNLGGINLKLGRFDEAEAHFREALAAAPGDRQSTYNLGVCLAAQGKYEESLDPLLAAEQAGAPSRPLLEALALSYEKTGQADKAREYRKRASSAESPSGG